MNKIRFSTVPGSLAVIFLGIVPSAISMAQVNVTTWRNDIGRTGQNTNESTLTTSEVTEARFGKVCSASVDGQVYAQPLVVWDAVNSRNIVYVVTMNNSVYAFDGKYIWVSTYFQSVVRLKPDGSNAGSFTVGRNPLGIAFDGASIWVANNSDNTVPTIANGYVIIGTQTDVDIYGVLPSTRTCSN